MTILWGSDCYPQLIDEETEAQENDLLGATELDSNGHRSQT
jgi:hypothetical protein